MESFTISWQIYSLLFINRLYSRISIVSRLRQGHKVFGFALFKGLVRLYMLPCMEQSGKGCLSYGKEDLVGSFGCCYKEVWRAVMGKDVTDAGLFQAHQDSASTEAQVTRWVWAIVISHLQCGFSPEWILRTWERHSKRGWRKNRRTRKMESSFKYF